ncbi:hypothetical protein C8F04DRAFT_1196281 [Mycena alexandri]|uniref:Uncharacterized protein n=1 Tax=Mycena alexandri TaxID=1745969 RepID=A0AAD6S4K1_9AGAR|nr:hypothetical protein C8F04DRAFT_1196281 [Mycena alexandri]
MEGARHREDRTGFSRHPINRAPLHPVYECMGGRRRYMSITYSHSAGCKGKPVGIRVFATAQGNSIQVLRCVHLWKRLRRAMKRIVEPKKTENRVNGSNAARGAQAREKEVRTAGADSTAYASREYDRRRGAETDKRGYEGDCAVGGSARPVTDDVRVGPCIAHKVGMGREQSTTGRIAGITTDAMKWLHNMVEADIARTGADIRHEVVGERPEETRKA